MTQVKKGSVPHCKDENVQAGRWPFKPGPTIYSKSDEGRYSRNPIDSSEALKAAEDGTGKPGNC